MCNGSTHAAADWPDLASALSPTFSSLPGFFTVPDLVTRGRFPRGGSVDQIGLAEDAAVSGADVSVAISDPGHTHPTMFEGNYGTKQSYSMNNAGFRNNNEGRRVITNPNLERITWVSAAEPTLHQSGVSATVTGTGPETRPVALRLLPAIYAGRPG